MLDDIVLLQTADKLPGGYEGDADTHSVVVREEDALHSRGETVGPG